MVDKTKTNISIIKFDDEWFIVKINNLLTNLFTRQILCDQFEELIEILNNIDCVIEDTKVNIFNEIILRGMDLCAAPATPNAYIINNEIPNTNT